MRDLFHLELQLMANALVLLAIAGRWAGWRTARRGLAALVYPGPRAVLVVGGLALVLTAGLGLAVHIPQPGIHDEFAYLLTGDTFADGRLSNPTHPMWEFFESPHIFHVPTYQAKYPPGQGLTLAAGAWLFGQPIFGVWITYSLACAAVCWMLQAYVPPRWALAGGLLCLCNPCMTLGHVLSYTLAWGTVYSHGWGQSYWGGGVAMLGGALLFGAFPRLLRRPTIGQSLLLGLGAALLVNSRPYESLVSSLPLVVVFWGRVLVRLSRREWAAAARQVLPVVGVLTLTLWAMTAYNQAVTGDPFQLPYQRWKELYSGPSILSTLLPAGVSSNQRYAQKLLIEWEFFVRMLLSVPLLFAFFRIVRDAWVMLAAICCFLALEAVLFQNTRGNPHYLAPVVAPFTLLLVCGLRQIATLRWAKQPVGRIFVRATLAVYVLSFAWAAWADWVSQPVGRHWSWTLERARIERELTETGQQHLIVVRYGSAHNWHHEWVYNRADIDRAPVVWAHDLGDEKNAQLREYFADRQQWHLNVNHGPGLLKRLDGPSTSARLADGSGTPQAD